MKYHREDHGAIERGGDGDERQEYVEVLWPPPRRKSEQCT
jgi:hypothetical protein